MTAASLTVADAETSVPLKRRLKRAERARQLKALALVLPLLLFLLFTFAGPIAGMLWHDGVAEDRLRELLGQWARDHLNGPKKTVFDFRRIAKSIAKKQRDPEAHIEVEDVDTDAESAQASEILWASLTSGTLPAPYAACILVLNISIGPPIGWTIMTLPVPLPM